MINAALKKKIQALLGKQYSPKIIAWLNLKEIFNENGEPFTPSGIQNIVNGRPHAAVEAEILNLLAETKRRQNLPKDKKSKILKRK